MMNANDIEWKRTEFFIESKVHIACLGEEVDILVYPEDDSLNLPSPSQLHALDAFLALDLAQKVDWSHQLALDCHYACLRDEIDGEDPIMVLRIREDVWDHVRLNQLLIPQHGTTSDRYLFFTGNCDWEEEHGLELLFKNERLIKVGPQEGLAQNEEWSLYFINE
jgi:hypothetical protein